MDNDKGILYFILALAAILVAGDLIIWQISQVDDAYDQNAAIASIIVRRNPDRAQERRLDRDMAQLEAGLDADYQALQTDLDAQ